MNSRNPFESPVNEKETRYHINLIIIYQSNNILRNQRDLQRTTFMEL